LLLNEFDDKEVITDLSNHPEVLSPKADLLRLNVKPSGKFSVVC